jgi:hypothetical protein
MTASADGSPNELRGHWVFVTSARVNGSHVCSHRLLIELSARAAYRLSIRAHSVPTRMIDVGRDLSPTENFLQGVSFGRRVMSAFASDCPQ